MATPVHQFSINDMTRRREADVTRKDDAGESLVEIVMSLVLLSLVVSALMAGLATAARATRFQRNLVKVDTVMRSFAEATKYAVRDQCGNTSTPGYLMSFVPYVPPAGYTIAPTGGPCPAVPPSPVTPVLVPPDPLTRVVTLTVVGDGVTRTMDIEVRRP